MLGLILVEAGLKPLFLALFNNFFDQIRTVKINSWVDKLKVDLLKLQNRCKFQSRQNFGEKKNELLGPKTVETGRKVQFLDLFSIFLRNTGLLKYTNESLNRELTLF